MVVKKALIIGHGSIGIRHLTMFNTVFDYNVSIAVLRKKSEKPFQFVQYFNNVEAAVNWQPDLVIIASPSYTHCKYLKVFSNSHILVEKPAVVSLDELSNIKLHNKTKLLKVAYNYRYHPEFIRMKNYFENNNISQVSFNHIDYLPNWHPWEDYKHSDVARDGVGLTLCHGFDILLELFKESFYDNLTVSRENKLDLMAPTSFSGKSKIENTDINFKIHCDIPDKNIFNFKIKNQNGSEAIFNFNNKTYTRNDTFIAQLIDLKNLINSKKDFSKEIELEYLRAKEILKICQL